ncbi:hypothetical protein [Pseudomonas sp. RT6P73]
MPREIRINAFDMNGVGHQSPGLWAHPRDRSWQYKDLEYWTDLAKILERGKFDGLRRNAPRRSIRLAHRVAASSSLPNMPSACLSRRRRKCC